MRSEMDSAPYGKVATPTTYADSGSTFEGWSGDPSGPTDPASITSEKVIASVILPTIPPPPPTMISPGSESSPGPVITTTTPTIEWTEVSEATDYGIYIRDLTANVLVFNSKARGLQITGSSYSLPPNILKMGRAYLWIMTSHNNAGLGYYGKIFYFQTSDGATTPAIPASPTLISPGSESSPGPVITTTTPTFDWTEVNGATDYVIYIRDITANILIFNSQELAIEIKGSSYSLPSGVLEVGKAYRWSTAAHNSAGLGDLAMIFYFQT